MSEARCDVCFRHCLIHEGGRGFCGARTASGGKVYPENYGRITSLALDPIEKKPLRRFYPGSRILSAGSCGCNLRCPFCQNYEISWSEKAMDFKARAEYLPPEELAAIAVRLRSEGNIGVAFTYNEPLISYEYIIDTARLIRREGMKTVLVTNGTAELHVLEKTGPYIDAMNIDLKGFSEHYYSDILDGKLEMVKDFITRAVQLTHVELTTLIVPGENDSEEEMSDMSRWIYERKDAGGRRMGEEIPLHVSRFFPCFHMTDRKATPVRTVYRLAEKARENLRYVYTGNC